MKNHPYQSATHVEEPASAPEREFQLNEKYGRPIWMNVVQGVCVAVVLCLLVIMTESVYEILRTRAQEPRPFDPEFSNSWFGNRSMERTFIKMVWLGLPFVIAAWLLRRKRYRRGRDVE